MQRAGILNELKIQHNEQVGEFFVGYRGIRGLEGRWKIYEKNNKVRSTAIFVVKNNDENKTKVQSTGILNELKIQHGKKV